MKAVVFQDRGGPEVVAVAEVPDPVAQRGEVLVRVRAAAMNRADLLQRRGMYDPPAGYRADLPGLELAGEIASVGDGVSRWKKGDRVMAIAAGEAQAELAVVNERLCVAIPDGMTFEEAGAVPEAFITAHDALYTQGGLRPGWPVLVHAVGSGVSTAAIQLIRATGATSIGTSRTKDKLDRARGLGMDHGLLLSRDAPAFADAVQALAPGGVPLLLDFVGASYLGENVQALAPGGRLVLIGLMGGPMGEILLAQVLMKRLRIQGTVLRSRPLEEKAVATQDFARDCLPLLARKAVRPVVDSVLPLARAREAHERMEANDSFGKIVLLP
jgi:putative PIG3 family NAD(P)H quinone oxidoreductase